MASHGRQSVVEARVLNGTILIYGATGYTGKLKIAARRRAIRERARSWPDAILIKSKGSPSRSV